MLKKNHFYHYFLKKKIFIKFFDKNLYFYQTDLYLCKHKIFMKYIGQCLLNVFDHTNIMGTLQLLKFFLIWCIFF